MKAAFERAVDMWTRFKAQGDLSLMLPQRVPKHDSPAAATPALPALSNEKKNKKRAALPEPEPDSPSMTTGPTKTSFSGRKLTPSAKAASSKVDVGLASRKKLKG